MTFDPDRFLAELVAGQEEDPEEAARALDDLELVADLGAFARAAWPVLEPRPMVWSWHCDAICEHLQAVTEGQIRRLVICVPPRMSKSSLVSVLWPAWHWLHKPAWRWLVAGAVERVVLRVAVKHLVVCS